MPALKVQISRKISAEGAEGAEGAEPGYTLHLSGQLESGSDHEYTIDISAEFFTRCLAKWAAFQPGQDAYAAAAFQQHNKWLQTEASKAQVARARNTSSASATNSSVFDQIISNITVGSADKVRELGSFNDAEYTEHADVGEKDKEYNRQIFAWALTQEALASGQLKTADGHETTALQVLQLRNVVGGVCFDLAQRHFAQDVAFEPEDASIKKIETKVSEQGTESLTPLEKAHFYFRTLCATAFTQNGMLANVSLANKPRYVEEIFEGEAQSAASGASREDEFNHATNQFLRGLKGHARSAVKAALRARADDFDFTRTPGALGAVKYLKKLNVAEHIKKQQQLRDISRQIQIAFGQGSEPSNESVKRMDQLAAEITSFKEEYEKNLRILVLPTDFNMNGRNRLKSKGKKMSAAFWPSHGVRQADKTITYEELDLSVTYNAGLPAKFEQGGSFADTGPLLAELGEIKVLAGDLIKSLSEGSGQLKESLSLFKYRAEQFKLFLGNPEGINTQKAARLLTELIMWLEAIKEKADAVTEGDSGISGKLSALSTAINNFRLGIVKDIETGVPLLLERYIMIPNATDFLQNFAHCTDSDDSLDAVKTLHDLDGEFTGLFEKEGLVVESSNKGNKGNNPYRIISDLFFKRLFNGEKYANTQMDTINLEGNNINLKLLFFCKKLLDNLSDKLKRQTAVMLPSALLNGRLLTEMLKSWCGIESAEFNEISGLFEKCNKLSDVENLAKSVAEQANKNFSQTITGSAEDASAPAELVGGGSASAAAATFAAMDYHSSDEGEGKDEGKDKGSANLFASSAAATFAAMDYHSSDDDSSDDKREKNVDEGAQAEGGLLGAGNRRPGAETEPEPVVKEREESNAADSFDERKQNAKLTGGSATKAGESAPAAGSATADGSAAALEGAPAVAAPAAATTAGGSASAATFASMEYHSSDNDQTAVESAPAAAEGERGTYSLTGFFRAASSTVSTVTERCAAVVTAVATAVNAVDGTGTAAERCAAAVNAVGEAAGSAGSAVTAAGTAGVAAAGTALAGGASTQEAATAGFTAGALGAAVGTGRPLGDRLIQAAAGGVMVGATAAAAAASKRLLTQEVGDTSQEADGGIATHYGPG